MSDTPKKDRADAAFKRMHRAMGEPKLDGVRDLTAKDYRAIGEIQQRSAQAARKMPPEHLKPDTEDWAIALADKHLAHFRFETELRTGWLIKYENELKNAGPVLKTDDERRIRTHMAVNRREADRALRVVVMGKDVLTNGERSRAWLCYLREVVAACNSPRPWQSVVRPWIFSGFVLGTDPADAGAFLDAAHNDHADLPEPAEAAETDDD